jgi:hypothetical protein
MILLIQQEHEGIKMALAKGFAREMCLSDGLFVPKRGYDTID